MTAPAQDFPSLGSEPRGDFQSLEKTKPLPKGWRWVKLGEVCEMHTGVRDPRTEPDREFRYVDISSVDSARKLIVEAKTLLEKMPQAEHVRLFSEKMSLLPRHSLI